CSGVGFGRGAGGSLGGGRVGGVQEVCGRLDGAHPAGSPNHVVASGRTLLARSVLVCHSGCAGLAAHASKNSANGACVMTEPENAVQTPVPAQAPSAVSTSQVSPLALPSPPEAEGEASQARKRWTGNGTSPAKGKSLRPLLARLLKIGIAAYIGVIVVLMALERYLIFHPVKASEDWETPPTAQVQDIELGTDGGRIHGWWAPV